MSLDVSSYVPVPVPTNQIFCTQWHAWVHGKVARHFKRDKERILDTAQNVRVRLLTRDFIGRWFFKHLREELVDKTQAERILGGVPITFVGSIQPFAGRRSSPDSLWRVSDLLNFARFDYERYYYSIQGHTIDSDKVLRLLGCAPSQYSSLQSMYRQGKLLPSELTEHDCKRRGTTGLPPSACPGCEHGVSLLRSRGLSLAHDWMGQSAAAASKLRWNDSQLAPYLRDWRKANTVFATPQFIMRTSVKPGIIAGLLKYAEMVIDHEVYNDFKRMARSDDLSCSVLNKAVSPEYSDSESMAWESGGKDGEESKDRVMRDTRSMSKFDAFEDAHDLARLLEAAGLSEEELDAVKHVDLGEMTVRQYAEKVGKPVPRVHRVRTSAMRKLRAGEAGLVDVHAMAYEVADRHGCTVSDMVGPGLIGPCVTARAEFFASLYDAGLSVRSIALRFAISEDRVTAAIARADVGDSEPSG